MPVIGHGVEICTSTTRPTIGITAGSLIYETDTLSYRWYNGTTWLGLIPEGTVQPYSGSAAPTGWLLCAGQTLNSITSPEYAPLFSVIGTTYGGTGASSFIIPDLRGRTPFGKDNMGGTTISRITAAGSGITGTTLGASGGSQFIASHTHDTGFGQTSLGETAGMYHRTGNSTFGSGDTGGAGGAGSNIKTVTSTSGNPSITNNSGTGNIPPAIILNYIIKF